ncbi:hypothetical protein BV53_05290 [Candidatus Synechococcus spongiarum LMB bulk15N]|uniref:Uncharacterized protein n=2 Tax=Candidatus Synechococcus spongiarum TaxID=431041 RepID=A0A1T1D1R6_9SYNE|nr:hypothetical protein BV53_05290 [Candidatus Synechococcus spongiarum LMB bulk15N]OOV36711.1 hypothetical protein BO98_00730 [Candidatus Synechococcus spongiarum LMB bulk10D]
MRNIWQFSAGCFMALAIVLVLPLANGSFAQDQEDPSEPTKVLQSDEASFNPGAVERLLSQGDEAVAAGDLETARKHYDDARSAARVLAGFYRDLSGAFRGLDARVPREMDAKGRRSITLQAEANLRLAALYRRLEQPEVAVPLLVDVIKLMTVTSPVGTQAYQQLVELGFAETTYAGPG